MVTWTHCADADSLVCNIAIGNWSGRAAKRTDWNPRSAERRIRIARRREKRRCVYSAS